MLNDDERISSALPDWQGRIWFVSKKSGVIGVLDKKTGKIESIRLGEEIENSFSIDKSGVYIASDKRMYRFNAGKDNKPVVDWKVTYKNSGITKPSQLNAGTGTTPTIFHGGDYVTITDNADPMNVVVYRTAKKLPKGTKRTVCETPVFGKGASATENSIIAAGNSLFVENNYGYQDPLGPNAGAPTTAGFARVDVNAKGTGCKVRWTNKTAPVPTVVSKLSTKTGLLYTYIAPTRTPTARRPGTGRRSTPRPARRPGASSRAPAWRSTTTTPASRSARTAPPTSGRSAACRRCATATPDEPPPRPGAPAPAGARPGPTSRSTALPPLRLGAPCPTLRTTSPRSRSPAPTARRSSSTRSSSATAPSTPPRRAPRSCCAASASSPATASA